MKLLPAWSERLLRAICPDELYEQIEGDLIEMYNYELKTVGKRKEATFYPGMFSILQARDFFKTQILIEH